MNLSFIQWKNQQSKNINTCQFTKLFYKTLYTYLNVTSTASFSNMLCLQRRHRRHGDEVAANLWTVCQGLSLHRYNILSKMAYTMTSRKRDFISSRDWASLQTRLSGESGDPLGTSSPKRNLYPSLSLWILCSHMLIETCQITHVLWKTGALRVKFFVNRACWWPRLERGQLSRITDMMDMALPWEATVPLEGLRDEHPLLYRVSLTSIWLNLVQKCWFLCQKPADTQ